MQTIPAKNLASGDVVSFPRVGKRTVKRLAGKNTMSIYFLFDDNKRRSMPVEKNVSATISAAAPTAIGESELFRLDLPSGRVSVISEGAFLWEFEDVKTAFYTLRVRVSATAERIALTAIKNGSRFYTTDAIYSKEAF